MAVTLDQQFIEFVVKTIVNNPDDVVVEREIDERGVLLTLSVNPEDVGRVIGKRGATAQSLRTLLRVLGTKNDARYNLKIVNTDEKESEPAPEKPVAEAEAEGSKADPPESDAQAEPDTDKDDKSAGEDTGDEDAPSELAEKTRAELADLDDLDI